MNFYCLVHCSYFVFVSEQQPLSVRAPKWTARELLIQQYAAPRHQNEINREQNRNTRLAAAEMTSAANNSSSDLSSAGVSAAPVATARSSNSTSAPRFSGTVNNSMILPAQVTQVSERLDGSMPTSARSL